MEMGKRFTLREVREKERERGGGVSKPIDVTVTARELTVDKRAANTAYRRWMCAGVSVCGGGFLLKIDSERTVGGGKKNTKMKNNPRKEVQ